MVTKFERYEGYNESCRKIMCCGARSAAINLVIKLYYIYRLMCVLRIVFNILWFMLIGGLASGI